MIQSRDRMQPDHPQQPSENPAWLEIVRDHVASLRFGVVEIVVHDSRVVQIEKTERVRLDKAPADSRPG